MTRKFTVYRFDPSSGKEAGYEEYEIPEVTGMSIMDVFDYIYLNLDPSLSYYSHSRCERGICARCSVRVNGKNCLACQTPIPAEGQVIIEPTKKEKALKDVVTRK